MKNKKKFKKSLLLIASAALIAPIVTHVEEVEASNYSWSKYNTVTKRSLSYNDGYGAGQVPYNYYSTVSQILNGAGLSHWNVSSNQVYISTGSSNNVFWIDSDTYFVSNASNMERPYTPRITPNASFNTFMGNLYENYIYVYNPTTKQFLSISSVQEGQYGYGGATYIMITLNKNEWVYSYSRGTLVGNVVGTQYAYVDNARNSDGYWYVRGAIANTSPTMNAISNQTVNGGSSINITPTIADADGDTLTLSASSSNTSIATVSTNNSLKRYTINGIKKGTATITATVQDSSGAKATRTFTVTVNNSAPTNRVTIPSQTIAGKGKTTSVNLANYFQDIDNDSLTYTVSSNATSKVTTSMSGSTLTLTGADKGSATITVTARDTSGATVSQSFTTTVSNSAPTNRVTIPSQTIAGKGKTTNINLANYFQDIDNDSLTYTVSSNATSKVTTSVSGSNLTLTGADKGSASITVTARDTSGATVSQTFTTTVSNTAPTNKTTIPSQIISGKGKTTSVNLANYFQDIDNDSLTYTASSNVTSKVTTSVSGSNLTLTGVDKGSASITVTAKDASGTTVSQTFTTTVNNTLPTNKTTIPAQTIEGKGKVVTVNLSTYFQDVDGDTLTYISSSNTTNNVTTSVSGNTLTLTGAAKGTASITVTAMDSSGGTVSQTFTTTVNNTTPINKSTIPAQTIIGKGQVASINLSNYFQDSDGDALTYTVSSNATGKVTTAVSGSTLNLNSIDKGSASITVTAKDTSGATVSQTFTTTVNNAVPTNKTTIPSQIITGKGQTKNINLSDYFEDLDDDVLSYTASSNTTSKVTTAVSGNTLTLTSVDKGSSTITVTAKDTSGGTVSQTFTTTVNNTTPTNKEIIPSQTIEGKGKIASINLANYFQDSDGDALTYTVSSNATDNVTTTLSGSALTLTGVDKGTASITVTAMDSSGGTVSQTFTTTVNNTTPTNKATISSQIINGKGQTASINLADYFQDLDGDALTYTASSNATDNVTTTLSGNTLTLTGVDKGTASITVTAMDSSGGTVSQTFTTTVNNTTPTNKATIPAQTIEGKGKTTSINLADYFQDFDSDTLTYTVSSNATNKVTTTVSGNTLTLTGVEKGSATITVTAKDTSGGTVSQTFTTTVNNTTPTNKTTIPSQTIEGKGQVINLNLADYFDDLDSDILTYTVSSNELNKVTASINGSKLILTGLEKGDSSITVTAKDTSGATVSQTFTTVVNVLAPINKEKIPLQIITGAGKLKNIDLSDYFEDLDGNVLTYIASSNATNKVTTAISGDILTLNGIAKGSTSVTVIAKNESGETVSQTFTTKVNNTTPVLDTNFSKLTLRPDELSSVILLKGTDLDGDNLNYIVTSSNDELVKLTVVDNQLVVHGLKEGSANITVKVTDGDIDYGNASMTKTFTVDVIEPAPVGPSEPVIDMGNTGGLTNGTVNLDDFFDDENPGDLIFTPLVLINEPEADIYVKENQLIIENAKKDGLISVDVEAMNIKGKKAITTFNIYLNPSQKNVSDKKATLKLEEGEFTLNTTDVQDFGSVKLTAAKQTVTTGFTGDFGVSDARGTQEGWHVTVSASPFEIETFEGFVGTPHQLPIGSLALNQPTSIERVGHVNKVDGLPTSSINDYTVVDNGSIALLNANQGEGLGEFKFNFVDALALTVDAVTAKIDKVNYPDRSTPYSSTVTWNLITGP